MWKAGTLPVPAEQLATGTVIVHPPAALVAKWSGALRPSVRSGPEKKADLERQLSRLSEYAVSKKMCVTDAVKEIGSGMNGHPERPVAAIRRPYGADDRRKRSRSSPAIWV